MRVVTLLALFATLVAASYGSATPANRMALTDYLGPVVSAKSIDCRTCHVAAKPTEDDHEHNLFGARLVGIRNELRKAGKPTDLQHRLDAIVEEDSDRDGFSNIVELLSGHAPGDATDQPSKLELNDIEAKRIVFRKHRASYPW